MPAIMIFHRVIKSYVKPATILLMRIAGIIAVYKICNNYDWKALSRLINWNSGLIITTACALYAIKQLVDAWRGKRLAGALNIGIPYFQLLKFNVQSIAFDFALPVPQAEEFYRFGRLTSYTSKTTAGIFAITLKLIGLFATACILAISILSGPLKLNTLFVGVSTFRIYFVAVDIIIAVLLIFILYLRVKLKNDPELIRKGMAWIKSRNQFVSIKSYYLLEGVGLAFLSQLTYAATIFFICKCNDGNITFLHVFLVVPLIYFAGLIPVGVAGLGIKEAVLAWSLQQFGMPQYIAWNIAFFHLIVMMLYLLTGVALLLTERKIAVTIASGS